MDYSHDKQQADSYAEQALERIKKEGLAPTPDFFELWYVYYARQNQDLREAIDACIKNKQPITADYCRELFDRYLSRDRNEETVRRAGEQINATIKNMSGVVRDVKQATADYGGKLDGVHHKITDIKNTDDLKTVVTTVLADTRTMLEHNQKLEQQLDQSAVVMETLQRDLEAFRKEALTDGLTGLANRKAFDDEIKRLVNEAEDDGPGFSLLMIDIDHFKSFNDNFGHQVGDQVLRLVAKTLTDGVKGRDIAARYGGEEFVIILPDTNLNAGVVVGNALRKSMANKDVINRNSGEKLCRITMSVGVAEYNTGEGISSLIERADAALYTAKHNGRNQVAAAPTPSKT